MMLSIQELSSASSTGAEGDFDASSDADHSSSAADEPDWSGDGTVEMAPNDSEWGGDAPPRNPQRLRRR